MIYGKHAVEEALIQGKPIDKIYIQMDLKSQPFSEIRLLAGKQYVPVQKVPMVKLNKLTRQKHQGIIAVVSPIPFQNTGKVLLQAFDKGEAPLFLILDNITDVRNFGAIVRSAASMGVHGVVIPTKGAAQITPESVKSSAGGLLTVPVCREPDLKRSIRYLKDSGLKILAATEHTDKSIDVIDLTVPTAIIFGAEGKGITKVLLDMADEAAKIPITGSIGSLNVSVAAGVILYEVMRQRNL